MLVDPTVAGKDYKGKAHGEPPHHPCGHHRDDGGDRANDQKVAEFADATAPFPSGPLIMGRG